MWIPFFIGLRVMFKIALLQMRERSIIAM